MKRKVIAVSFQNAPTTHPISGATTLNPQKNNGIEMYTGLEPGMLTVIHQNVETGVPLANCRSVVWEASENKQQPINK